MSDVFDPYFKWLGIPKGDQPPHAYRLLGIELFESDTDVISNAADGRMTQIKNFQSGKFAAVSQKLLNEIAGAKVCLLNPAKKAEYDRRLKAHLQKKAAVASTQAEEAEVEEPDVAEDNAAGLSFLDGSIASTSTTPRSTRPVKKAKRAAWLVPAGVGLLTLVAGIAAYVAVSGDGKGKTDPQTVAFVGSGRDWQAKESAKSSIKAAGGTGESSPKPSASAPRPSAGPVSPPPKLESRPKPKIEIVDPENNPSEEKSLQPSAEKSPEKKPEKSPEQNVPGVAENSAANSPAAKVDLVKRKPIPDKGEFQTLKSKIQQIFQKEIAEAKTPELKLALANKLAEQGDQTKDSPADCYVLWRLAADEASLAGDFRLAVEIVEKIQEQYDVDGDAIRLSILSAGAGRTTLTPEAARNFCETGLKLAATATAQENFDAAASLAKLAASVARHAKDPQLNRDALSRGHEIDRLKTRYAVVAKALATLKSDGENAEAKLVVGQWYCLDKGDWDKGLPMLAKGSRDDLAELATRELAKPVAAKDQAALGDAWWALGEKQTAAHKLAMESRARHWYELALPQLSGLDKTRVEKRLEQANVPSSPGPVSMISRRGVVQKGNVALGANGTSIVANKPWVLPPASLFNGNPPRDANDYAMTAWPCEWIITLNNIYSLQMIRFRLWDMENRYYRYRVWTSSDGKNFALAADHSTGEWRSWQDIKFPPRQVKFVKLEGLYGSANDKFHVFRFEAYCVPPQGGTK